MTQILLIGYGNTSRCDDGVAIHILLRLRERLGLSSIPLGELEDDLEHNPAILCVHQLAPEMAETLSNYDIVVFIDAHVEGLDWSPVHWREITPALRPSMVSHHLKPEALLALCKTLYGSTPQGHTLSVLGTDFDFGEELSQETSERADEAVERIVALLEANDIVIS